MIKIMIIKFKEGAQLALAVFEQGVGRSKMNNVY